jgi:hypothetical protein
MSMSHMHLRATALQGYRGLIASADLSPGDVVVSVPLHNILQVPRQMTGAAAGAAAAAAAAIALDRWQQQHGALPENLLDLILGAQRKQAIEVSTQHYTYRCVQQTEH